MDVRDVWALDDLTWRQIFLVWLMATLLIVMAAASAWFVFVIAYLLLNLLGLLSDPLGFF